MADKEIVMDVRPGTHRYVRFNGAAKHVREYLDEEGYAKPVVITGHDSWDGFVKAGGQVGDAPVLHYDHTVTWRNIDELSAQAKELGADVIVAIGGGKLCDTAKGVHYRTNIPIVTVPTIAATCAAASSVIIVYDENGKRIPGDIPLRRGAELIVADPLIIAAAPLKYLLSGIGDTLAKWYEAEGIQRHIMNPEPADVMGLKAAEVTRDYLVREGDKAIESVKNGISDETLGHMVDVIIHIASCVGGFAGANGRVSGAHAVHDALTALPATKVAAHGQKVAYGILVQLAAQNDWDEFDRLIPTYRKIGLPCTFKECGADPSDENLKVVSDLASSPKSSFIHAVPDIDTEKVVECIRAVDKRAAAIDAAKW